MAERKKRAEQWIAFAVNRFIPQYWADIKAGRLVPQLIGVVLAILILGAQIYFGVIAASASGIHARLLSIAWPYAVLIAGFLIYHAARTPWLISNDHLDAAEQLRGTIAERDTTIHQQHETIHTLSEKPKRTPAEQHDYDAAKECLRKLGQTGIDALRFLRKRGTLSFNSSGGCSAELPAELKQNALWAYRCCADEGVVACNNNLYSIPPKMETILEELLFQDKGLSGFAGVRRK